MAKNKIKKIIVIFGTRPEAIKMAPVLKALKRHPGRFKTIVCLTAQHRELLDEVLRLFSIKADYDLNIMKQNQGLFEITTRGLAGLKGVLEKEKPDFVFIQGDTTSAFVSALAAFYLKIPVGHVEAGLRTNDKFHPFPEEINRRLASELVDLHFAPTGKAKENLISEGIPRARVFVTGNTVIDALLHISKKNKESKSFKKRFSFLGGKISRMILVTAHRRENFGEGLENICFSLKKIIQKHKDLIIVYPVHPNPNVRVPVERILGKIDRVKLIPPVDYSSFIYLMGKSYIILTDSGGIQEEATAIGKPLLIMREETERPEAVEAGLAKLVGTDMRKIVKSVDELLSNKRIYRRMARRIYPFGNGKAADKIVKIMQASL